MIRVIITDFVSFVSTNIDDICILMLFFSQTNNVMKRSSIVIGQYLGIGVLTIISIIGALGISLISSEYVGLFGLLPIYLGIKAYIDHKKESIDKGQGQQELENVENSKIQETTDIGRKHIITFMNISVVKVASVTFANGGDNIGIYIPLFISMSLAEILVTVTVFLFLTALWCFIALKVIEYPFVQRNIEKNKHIFVPIIFIGLGVFILTKGVFK